MVLPGYCLSKTAGTACKLGGPSQVHFCVSGTTYYTEIGPPPAGVTYSWVGVTNYCTHNIRTYDYVDTSNTLQRWVTSAGCTVIFKQSGSTIYPMWWGNAGNIVNPAPNQPYPAQWDNENQFQTSLPVYYKVRTRYTQPSGQPWVQTQSNSL